MGSRAMQPPPPQSEHSPNRTQPGVCSCFLVYCSGFGGDAGFFCGWFVSCVFQPWADHRLDTNGRRIDQSRPDIDRQLLFPIHVSCIENRQIISITGEHIENRRNCIENRKTNIGNSRKNKVSRTRTHIKNRRGRQAEEADTVSRQTAEHYFCGKAEQNLFFSK